ncbi:cache domain-containing protein, partial [Nitratidesulfovibrio liaohensis]|uniref:cache domain-containing protein n=1 Tax=Nitratidesulfovibrio liaohensis TaxID=2604158 RepID=UPI001AAEB5F3
RLAATVTALAQALGELAATQPDENARRELLVRAVDPVRTSAAHWDYVFLSRGTVNVHTPTLPDAGGVDFGAATDVHGVRFVQRMMDTARTGGGFTEWTADLGEGRTEARRAYTLAVPGTDYWLGAWAPVVVQAAGAPTRNDPAQLPAPTPRTLEFHALRLGWLAALGVALLVGVLT